MSINDVVYAKSAYIFDERLGGLESGHLVFGDDDGSVLGDVACCLLLAGLHDEAAEAAEIYILAVSHGILDNLHEFFYSSEDGSFLQTGATRNFVYNISFCHDYIAFVIDNSAFVALFVGIKNPVVENCSANIGIIFEL